MFATALCTIHRAPSETGEVEVVLAPSVFKTNKDEFAQLEELNAVRKSTKEEIENFQGAGEPLSSVDEAALAAEAEASAKKAHQAKPVGKSTNNLVG